MGVAKSDWGPMAPLEHVVVSTLPIFAPHYVIACLYHRRRRRSVAAAAAAAAAAA